MYQIFKNVLFTKGYNRTLLYDSLSRQIHFLPNDVFNMIHINNYKLNETTDKEILNFLSDKNLIFKSKPTLLNNFPNINNDIDIPYKILTTVVELSLICAKNLHKFNSEEINGMILQFNFILNHDTCKETLAFLSDFMMKNEADTFELTICEGFTYPDELFELMEPLNKIFVLNNYANIEITDTSNKKNRFINQIDVFNRQISFNYLTYFESSNHNVYYNRHLFIGKNTEIKNTLESEYIYDYLENLKHLNLDKILNEKEFTVFWKIKKEDTLICVDCEFKRFCVDNRIPKKINNKWSYEIECDYNPYISKWEGEEGYKTLKELNIDINNKGEIKIDLRKINAINNILWCE